LGHLKGHLRDRRALKLLLLEAVGGGLYHVKILVDQRHLIGKYRGTWTSNWMSGQLEWLIATIYQHPQRLYLVDVGCQFKLHES